MKTAETIKLTGNKKNKSAVERIAQVVFTICASFTILAVFSILVYMFINGTPALFKVGIKEILFGTVWKPTAAEPQYGIFYVILTSIVGTVLAILIGVPIGLLTAVFLAEVVEVVLLVDSQVAAEDPAVEEVHEVFKI